MQLKDIMPIEEVSLLIYWTKPKKDTLLTLQLTEIWLKNNPQETDYTVTTSFRHSAFPKSP